MFSGGTPPSAVRTSRRVASSRRLSRAPSAALGSPQAERSYTPEPAFRNGSPATPSAAASVLGYGAPATPSARSRARSEAGTVLGVGMELDGLGPEEDKLLVKDAAYQVTQRKSVPEEIRQVVAVADSYTDPFRAELDSLTGFGWLISREYCFVWNWGRRTHSATASTAYIFPLPPTHHSLDAHTSHFSPLSFAALVPSPRGAAIHEPGLLVLSPTGALRHWSAVSQALSGARFSSGQAPLVEGELVRGLQALSGTSYLAPTSAGRLLVVSLEATGTKGIELNVRIAERPTGWGGAVWSAVFGAGGSTKADPRAGVIALALSPQLAAGQAGERLAYVLTAKEVQIWRFPVQGSGGERLVVEHDLLGALLQAVTGGDSRPTNEEWATNAPRLEVVDAVVAPSGQLAVLVSYVAQHTNQNALSYAIVQVEVGSGQVNVTPTAVKHLTYQAVPDPRPLSQPKLTIPAGETAFVVFVDAVLMVSLEANIAFEEAFPLRSPTHRFFGLSTPAPAPSATSSSVPAEVTLSLLSSTPSILSVTVNPAAAPRAAPKTKKLQTRLEQAVFYGGAESDNPLAFDLRPGWEGDLSAAAEAVSGEIAASSAAAMPFILDLRAQLADRVGRSRALIEFINANGLLGKLSQTSRRQLRSDGERLAAAVALWQHQNARFGGQGSSNLLANAVISFMAEIGEGSGEDPLRTFFRAKVAQIGAVLDQVTREAKRLERNGDELLEANTILTLVFSAANRFRADTARLYAIDPAFVSAEPWTARPAVLDALQWHFDATEALLEERTRTLGSSLESSGSVAQVQQAVQAELKTQMASIAGFAFGAFEERILLLTTLAGESGTSAELRTLSERYLTLRPRFIHVLVAADKVPEAYELAEKHRDFGALVELCNDGRHGNPARIRRFLDVYQEDYAFALFQFYVDQGLLRRLLEPDEQDIPLLTRFLDKTGQRRIAWLNDLAIDRFDAATEGLVGEALEEQDLAQKKLMLSLGKLSQVAQATSDTLDTEPVQRAIEGVDDLLDLVNSQQSLEQQLRARLAPQEQHRLRPENQAEFITARVAPQLGEALPALAQLYTSLAQKLLAGQSLTPEDLVDLLTLKLNEGEQSADYAAALEILVRARSVPEARRQLALQATWRRVYLADDWAALRAANGLSDQDLAHALRATALYATLAAAQDAKLPNSMFLDPDQTLAADSGHEELEARFPDAPKATLERLLGDIQRESAQVEALQKGGLAEFAAEIGRLLLEDVEREAGGEEDEEDGMEV